MFPCLSMTHTLFLVVAVVVMIAVQTGLKSGLLGMRGRWTRCCPVSDRWGWRFTDEIHLLMVCVLLYECLNRRQSESCCVIIEKTFHELLSSSCREETEVAHWSQQMEGTIYFVWRRIGLRDKSCERKRRKRRKRQERERQSSTISIRCLHWEVQKVKKKRRKNCYEKDSKVIFV